MIWREIRPKSIAVTLTLLTVLGTDLDLYLTRYFEAKSYPEAHGHNIVNVILTDTRALDTFGEVIVLMVVAVDVGLATPLLAVVLPVLLAAGVLVHRHRLPGWPIRLGLLAALVVLVVPVHYGMAVKWVNVAGLVVMPVAGWAAGRLAGLPFPGPALTSVATLPFLFDQ